MDQCLNPVSTTFTSCVDLVRGFTSLSHRFLLYKLEVVISTSRPSRYLGSKWNHVFALVCIVPGNSSVYSSHANNEITYFHSDFENFHAVPVAFACQHFAHPKTSTSVIFYTKTLSSTQAAIPSRSVRTHSLSCLQVSSTGALLCY